MSSVYEIRDNESVLNIAHDFHGQRLQIIAIDE
jgi:hypothetical protein